MAKTSLPPGFRFHPTDIELVKYYLKRKVMQKKLPHEVISELDIYKYAPWDLPEKSCLKSRDLKWYFFCPREKKYSSGARMNRATEFGYWKTTGKDRPILHNNEVAGLIKTLIFHRGRAPKGARTDWVMHEYKLEDKDVTDKGFSQDAYVICMIFQKDGPGPRNGAQYGAPFEECEWDEEDDDVAFNSVEASPSSGLLSGRPVKTATDPSISTAHGTAILSVKHSGPANKSCMSGILPSVSNVTTLVPADDHSSSEQIPNALNDDGDDVLMMLDQFTETDAWIQNETTECEVGNHPTDGDAIPETSSDGNDLFNGLGDLANSNSNSTSCFYPQAMCDASFLELMDLNTPLDYVNNPNQATLENLQRLNPQINNETGQNIDGFTQENLYGYDCCLDLFDKENGINS